MKPIVSILIPVYNREKFIGACIESALAQTFADLEVIVVDNASSDETWSICQHYAELDSRVKIFRNDTNIGPVRNWLRCAQEAKGKFSKILFSDDCLEPNCLSEMLQRLNDSDVALVYCAVRIGKCRDESIIAYAQPDSSRIGSTQFLNLIISGKAPVSPGAILLRTRDLLNNLHTKFSTSTVRQFDKNGAGPDVMILLLTAHNYLYVANVSSPLIFFREHAGSFTIKNTNNEIIKGYLSVFALFLLSIYGRQSWLKYLAYRWLQEMRFGRRWESPRSHLVEYEGSGSTGEVLSLLSCAFMHLASKLFRKQINVIK